MNSRTTIAVRVVCIAMLLWALRPHNAYGYYVLLRWVLCASLAFLAVRSHAENRNGWVWLFAVAAALYNPILRVHLGRDIWLMVNAATIVLVLISFFAGKGKERVADN